MWWSLSSSSMASSRSGWVSFHPPVMFSCTTGAGWAAPPAATEAVECTAPGLRSYLGTAVVSQVCSGRHSGPSDRTVAKLFKNAEEQGIT
jgi:hypothetical protein